MNGWRDSDKKKELNLIVVSPGIYLPAMIDTLPLISPDSNTISQDENPISCLLPFPEAVRDQRSYPGGFSSSLHYALDYAVTMDRRRKKLRNENGVSLGSQDKNCLGNFLALTCYGNNRQGGTRSTAVVPLYSRTQSVTCSVLEISWVSPPSVLHLLYW